MTYFLLDLWPCGIGSEPSNGWILFSGLGFGSERTKQSCLAMRSEMIFTSVLPISRLRGSQSHTKTITNTVFEPDDGGYLHNVVGLVSQFRSRSRFVDETPGIFPKILVKPAVLFLAPFQRLFSRPLVEVEDVHHPFWFLPILLIADHYSMKITGDKSPIELWVKFDADCPGERSNVMAATPWLVPRQSSPFGTHTIDAPHSQGASPY